MQSAANMPIKAFHQPNECQSAGLQSVRNAEQHIHTHEAIDT